MFERQAYQLTFTFLGTFLVLYLGKDLFFETKVWLFLSLFAAIFHHTYVWFFWRLELSFKWVTKKFPARGFNYYVFGFFILFTSRLITIIFLAYHDRISINIPIYLKWSLVLIISSLSGYTFYCVHKYFGMKRATGADHFFEKYRNIPFVKKGIFRYTNNAMYTFGTSIIFLPGLLTESKFALILGFFNYLLAWVHYFCLEKPDIKRIYENK